MSFGFAIGDFLTAGKLIAQAICALKDAGGSKQQYQRLILELHVLQVSLEGVEKLDGPDELGPVRRAIKDAALNGLNPLLGFLKMTEKYNESLGVGQSSGRLRGAGEKIMWATKREDIQRFRQEMNSHVVAINMLLGLYQVYVI